MVFQNMRVLALLCVLTLSLFAAKLLNSALADASGLVAAYPFGEAVGTTTADAAGNNDTGTLVGSTAWTTAGKYGSALSFNGTDAAVRVPSNSTWKVNGLGGYTVSMWVKVKNTSASYKAVIGTGSWPSDSLLIYKDGNKWSFSLQTAGGPDGWSCAGETSALGYLTTVDNTYHHIALVLDSPGGRCDFYSDGLVAGSDPYVDGTTSFNADSGDLYIGGLSGGQYLNADIDEVRIYTTALNQTEIQADMNNPIGGTQPDTTPPIISALHSSNVTTTTAVIAWNTDEPADSRVEYGLTTGYGNMTALDSSLVVSHNQGLAGLTPNTLYHYRVHSKDAAGNAAVSADATFTTLAPGDTTPPEITNVSASGLTHNAATINWTTDEPADTRVEYGTTLAYGSFTNLVTTLVTIHSQTLSGLSANTLYHYRVHSKDASGNPSMSGDFTFTTLAPPQDVTPPVISGISAGSISSSSATIAWTTNEASDSQVEYGLTTAYGSSTALNTALVTSHSQTLNGLTGNTLYHYRVRSKDAAGNQAISTDRTFTTLPSSIGFQEVFVAGGFDTPTAMEFAPDGRLFVAEKSGQLRIIQNGQLLSTPFFTANVSTLGEQGLLGIAFDPDFATNHFVYIYYTATNPTHNRVSRLTANGNMAVPGSELVLLDLPALGTIAHQGGAIHFGNDGKLYVAVGDHQISENVQSLSNPLGKMLRINKDGSIPTDNPFFNQTTGINQAIYALGLRNPYTFAVDPATGRIFINDVGNSAWEEINQLVAGANYGWPICEGPQGSGAGSCNNPSFTYPIHAYARGAEAAVTGGTFYRGNQFPGQYVGDYFFSDYTRGWIRFLDSSNQVQGINNPYTDFRTASFPVDLKVGPDGALYYLSIGLGEVSKIEYASGNLNPVAQVSAVPTSGQAPLNVVFDAGGSQDPDNDPLTYTWNFGDGSPAASGVTVSHTYQTQGLYSAVLTVSDGRGGMDTETQTITVGTAPVATITAPATGSFYSAGDTIFYQGTATDSEDGPLPPGAFSWTIVFHHDQHTHPFQGPINGVTSGSFQIPLMDHTETNVWYRINLNVTDSTGLQHQIYRDIFPNKVMITLNTNFPGLQLTLDGQPTTAPLTFESVVGVLRQIGAPSPQVIGNTQYVFESWSDGGTATHTISTPQTNTTYTATFQAIPTGPVTTNWFYPTVQSAQTSGSGDNNGYEGSPANLLADDGLFATDTNSGTNNNTNCGNAGKDRHQVRDFSLTLPAGKTTVRGFEVRLDAKVDSTNNAPRICVQLSWNGGSSWTAAKSTPTLSTTEQTYILGGPTDLWGRSSWTTSQFSNANFRVRVASVASSSARDFSLDAIGVRITGN
jgi:glucose/arabinose dehydrogenase